MSNARIFCIGLVTWVSLDVTAKLLGFDGNYTGMAEHIVRMSIGFTWGAWAVVLWGDRTPSNLNRNEGTGHE